MFGIQDFVGKRTVRKTAIRIGLIGMMAVSTACSVNSKRAPGESHSSRTQSSSVEEVIEVDEEVEGETWFRLAAEQKDAQIAANWYILAATKGHVIAQRTLGWLYAEGMGVAQNDREAVKWYQQAAENGDIEACFDSGWMHLHGRGVSKSDEEAAKWFRRAGTQGNVRAQGYLGWMYQEGRGVPQDSGEAIRWLVMAAEQGSSVAQYHLGIMYAQGRGVPQDKQEAQKWLQKASARAREETRQVVKKR